MNVASVALVSMVSAAACGASLTLGEPNLVGDQLTVPVTVGGYSSGTLELLIGEAGPRNGEPDATTSAASLAITADGTYNLTAQVSVGAKIAYRAALGSDVSPKGVITATDNVQYIWVTGNSGNWHDPANWTRDSNDGYKSIGYPAYTTGQVRFLGNQTAVVAVDADYSFGDLFIDNANLNLTIKGNGCTLDSGNPHCAGNTAIRLDNVRIPFRGGFGIGNNGSLVLVNGAFVSTIWTFNVSGQNAYLYVGSGCEVSVDAWNDSSFNLEGSGAKVEIEDGYVHSYYMHISRFSNTSAPYGFVFKGDNPRLHPKYTFSLSRELSEDVVMEFFVPRGGYSGTPVYVREGTGNNYFPNTSNECATKIKVVVSKNSPYYQDNASGDFCLIDWRGYWVQGINTGAVSLESMENPETDYLYYKDYTENDKTWEYQVWSHLTGTGTPADLPTLSTTATATVDSSTATVSISGTVESLTSSGYDTKLELWVATLGPKDDPAGATLAKVDTETITAAGNVSFDYVGTLGSKIAYKLVLTADNGIKTWECGATAVQSIVLMEGSGVGYDWTGGGGTGIWSDPANWSRVGGDYSLSHIGYPTWGVEANFYSSVDTVVIDADYEQIGTVRMGNSVSSITFKSDTPSAVRTIEVGSISAGANIAVTLDGVVFGSLGNPNAYPGNYSIGANSSLSLYNGGGVQVRWEFVLDGENARLYVGTNCFVRVSAAEPYHRLELSGTDAEIAIDGGTVDALFLGIAGYWNDGEHPHGTHGIPKGITFSGKNPQLRLDDHMGNYKTRVYDVLSTSPEFRFIIPEGGYDSTPVVRYGKDGTTLFPLLSEGIPAVKFVVDRNSPYLKARGDFTQQLLDWSSSTADPKLNTAGVTFARMPRDKERMYFTPESGDVKSGIAVDCKGKQGLSIILR